MVFNLSQGIESFILAYLGEKEFEKAAIYGVSTLVSTAVGDIGMGWFKGSQAEKYVSEPIVAGILSGVGMYAFKKKEKDRFLSPFARGFAYTGATAGLNSVLAANYIGLPREISTEKYATAKDASGNPITPAFIPIDQSYGGLREYVVASKAGGFSSNMVN